MTFIDSHTHLYLSDFKDDIATIMNRAEANGVDQCYLPAIDSTELDNMLALEASYPRKCIAMIGLHPCSVKENYLDELAIVKQWLQKRPFAAIGEAGLDFYWDKTFTNQQYDALKQQMQWALEYNRPIVLHTRNATRETIDTVKSYAARGLRGIFHCFSGNAEEAKEVIDMNFLLGIGGVVTYKNSGMDKVVAEIPLEHIVLETDAPYLTPVPFRGKRNESSYLKIIAEKVSAIKGVPLEDVASITTANARRIFSF
jgi:TatD DNase family protein